MCSKENKYTIVTHWSLNAIVTNHSEEERLRTSQSQRQKEWCTSQAKGKVIIRLYQKTLRHNSCITILVSLRASIKRYTSFQAGFCMEAEHFSITRITVEWRSGLRLYIQKLMLYVWKALQCQLFTFTLLRQMLHLLTAAKDMKYFLLKNKAKSWNKKK